MERPRGACSAFEHLPYTSLGPLLVLPKNRGLAIFHSDEQQRQNVFQLDKTQNLGAERDTSISSLKITLGPPGLRSNLELTPRTRARLED